MGNLFGYEGWEITSDEEGLGEVDGIDVEVILAADLLPPDGQREEDGVFSE